jgi:hypothetical protein
VTNRAGDRVALTLDVALFIAPPYEVRRAGSNCLGSFLMKYEGVFSVGFAVVILFARGIQAGDTEVTLKGTILCAKCAVKEAKKCQTAIQVKENGKTVTYYFKGIFAGAGSGRGPARY